MQASGFCFDSTIQQKKPTGTQLVGLCLTSVQRTTQPIEQAG
jgi:hypothetical protein